MPVNTAPIRTPRIGLLKAVRILVNSGILARGATESLIRSIPNISTEKPTMMVPTSRFFALFAPIIIITPMRAIIGEKFSGLSMDRKKLSVLRPFKPRIQAVRVVPTLEPMITPTVCDKSIIPELTRPTSITVRADDDWMAIVITAPSTRLFPGLEVSVLSIPSSLPPATFSRLPDITCIPKRKKASPPQSVIIE